MTFATKFPELSEGQRHMLLRDLRELIGANETPINREDEETFIQNDLKDEIRVKLTEYILGG